MARVVVKELAEEITFDSAGLGNWHIGKPPHKPMRQVAAEKGYPIDDLSARQVKSTDFQEFDWIVAMDSSNLEELKRLKDLYGGKAQLSMLLDPKNHGQKDVPDPYYGDMDLFYESFGLIERAVPDFLRKL